MNESALQSVDGPALLSVRALDKLYWRRQGWRTHRVVALQNVDLEVRQGSVLAIIGESGSGKTTLARCIAGMERPDGGSILFAQLDLATLPTPEMRQRKAQVQLIFQDPSTALNPRFTAEELIAEPLLICGSGTREANAAAVARLMSEVGLSPAWRQRRPSEFSGGQLQRIAIARALAIEPRLLILDEAFTGLDLSTAAQIANLLLDLRRTRGLTYILISHDVAFAAQFADEIAVMEGGRIVEDGPALELLSAPKTGATRRLVQAASHLNHAISLAAGQGA